MSSDNQLLVLGNGFDLQCGLKSSFDDFMKTRNTIYKNIDQSINYKLRNSKSFPVITITNPFGEKQRGKTLPYMLWNKGLTVWDFILDEDKKRRTWFNIESCIKRWVNYRPTKYKGRENCYKSNVDWICERYSKINWNSKTYSHLPVDAESCIISYARFFYKWNGKPETLLNLLLDQLHRFEQVFAVYLQKQLKKSHTYKHDSTNLILNIANDEIPHQIPVLKADIAKRKFLGKPNTINILDFNFTYPMTESWKNRPYCINIHGQADENNIIFGVDGLKLTRDHEDYKNMVQFTKTYRLMALSGKHHRSLVYPHRAGSPDKATSMIKFFGHSLDFADYSYFQAIFDEVELYESDTRLIFYYNENRRNGEKGNKGEKRGVKEEMFREVNRLIVRYGESLDNKDHGRNLLHKLLLEGRLTIKQAPLVLNPAYYQ